MLLTGCGSEEPSSEADYEVGSDYGYDYDYDYSSETEAESYDLNFECAIDLIGQPLADIKASGFDYKVILNLNQYDFYTAKPYTILVDGSSAFAAAVICKDDAVIANGIETSVSINDLGDIDINEDLGWSAAFQAHFAPRILTTTNSEKYHLRYMWKLNDPNNYFSVDTSKKSNCAIVYKDSYVYPPDYDFMWFNWGSSIYDVKSDLTSRGFYVEESPLVSNSFTTESVSEQLYGHDFYIYLHYNDNFQFTEGTYAIYGTCPELADIYEAACKDLISKYGDTNALNMYKENQSLNVMLETLRNSDYVDPYHFCSELQWIVEDRTAIILRLYSNCVEIEYRSISSTGGTNLNEDSLI